MIYRIVSLLAMALVLGCSSSPAPYPAPVTKPPVIVAPPVVVVPKVEPKKEEPKAEPKKEVAKPKDEPKKVVAKPKKTDDCKKAESDKGAGLKDETAKKCKPAKKAD